MRYRLLIAVPIVVAGGALLATQRSAPKVLPNTTSLDGVTQLPNGWRITPAGRHLALPGDDPVKIAFTPDGKQAVVLTGGSNTQGVSLIDLKTEKILQTRDLATVGNGLALGDGKVFVTGGKNPSAEFTLAASGLSERETRIDKDRKVEGRFLEGAAYGNGSLYVVDMNHNSVARYENGRYVGEGRTGHRPFACALSPDGKTLAVTNMGGRSVSLFDASTLAEKTRVMVGAHPMDALYAKDGRLFVANAGSNTVSVIRDGKEIETVRTSLRPSDKVGSTPSALALSPNGSTLYVANAGNNNVMVADVHDVEETRVVGFIPTGWYPTSVAVTPDGKRLIVGSGKGLKFAPNFPPKTTRRTNANTKKEYDYICGVLSGALSFVDIGNQTKLNAYSRQVAANTPSPTDGGLTKAEIAQTTDRALRKIKHVLYIIRENRTYDQVMGDVKEGNGDPELCFFGQKITPNAHKLAHDFVLLDNLYCNGEVSQDGHQWCDAAYATAFTEHAYANSYSGRSQPDEDDRLVASPGGYLWDNCKKNNLSYFSYGESADFTSSPGEPPKFNGSPALEGHANPDYKCWGQRDTLNADVFIRDLKKAEASGNWPACTIMSLPWDHTSGLQAGVQTPQAMVAENDHALGRIVDAISHSRFWPETAIFVIEDDAQNGPDHVDAHRTVGLVISPYTRRNYHDSTLYTTSSMVRTIEMILGLPTMSQYDTDATPMVRSFTAKRDTTPYTALAPNIDIEAKNPQKGLLAEMSKKLDFSDYDRADPDAFNEILWTYFRPGKPMPAPVRSAALIR